MSKSKTKRTPVEHHLYVLCHKRIDAIGKASKTSLVGLSPTKRAELIQKARSADAALRDYCKSFRIDDWDMNHMLTACHMERMKKSLKRLKADNTPGLITWKEREGMNIPILLGYGGAGQSMLRQMKSLSESLKPVEEVKHKAQQGSVFAQFLGRRDRSI